MKRSLLLLSFLAFLFATSCELVDDKPKDFVPDKPDESGNLLIMNNSGERLVLYKDEYIVKKIPASATDFLVHVDNPGEGTVQLDVYLWEDVKDDLNNPSPGDAYKTWLVPLANSDAVEERATWHLSGSAQYTDVATINFNYYGGTDNYVDVFLNGRTGAKVMTLAPGQQYKKVGVDYGNYTLHYNYWFSNQNDAVAKEERGWIEKENINGEEKDIWLILNENRKDVTFVVPHLGAAANKGTKYANLKIKNTLSDPVQIYVGDKLIESLCYLEEGNAKNLSTIDYQGEYTFIMPITEEDAVERELTLTAKHLTTSEIMDQQTITVIADETVTWNVDDQAEIQ